jgi:pseudomonalisin/xanthomonalisin
MRLVRHTVAAVIAAAFGGVAFAGTPGWVATHTQAPEVYSSLSGAPMAAQEEVAPGQAVHIAVTLKLRNEADLEARVARIRAGSTADFITTGQAHQWYLPTPAQAQAVVDHLRQAGFTNIQVAANRLVISADGSAANVKTAFHTALHHFGQGAERRFANVDAVQVPGHLADVVLAVHGLQNAATFHTMSHVLAQPMASTASVTGHNPTDFPLLYDASSLPAASNATLAIISEGDMTQTLTDLKAFEAKAGYAPVDAQVVTVGAASTDTSGTVEWNLDSQDSLAAAGGALKQMIFYTATSLQDAPLTQAYNQAVSDNKAKVINVSLGECEKAAKRSGIEASNDQIFKLGMAQGQTFSISSGDSGSHECGKRKPNAQSYPAVSPYVMAIGGTTVSSNGTTYVSESTWSGGGGGNSLTEAAPAWQTQAGVLTLSGRGVPDISFDADPASGAIIIVGSKNEQVGGTSLAAPLFAGFWARIQSDNGNALGFPAASLYKYAKGNPGLFHDVTTGSNGGFTAAAGWDYATGWGSLDIAKLDAFIKATPGF